MEFIELKAALRDKFGTSNARRLRKDKKIPATIYAKNTQPIHLILYENEIKKNLKPHHHFYSLKIDTGEYRVFLKSIQQDHLGSSIYQIDFETVEAGKMFEIKIPVKYVGVPKGVVAGGHIEYNIHEIVVMASIDNIIEEFTVDISNLDLKERLKISDLKLPAGISIKSPPPNTVMVIIREAVAEEAKPVEAAVATAAPAEEGATATTQTQPPSPTTKPQEKKEPEKKTKP